MRFITPIFGFTPFFMLAFMAFMATGNTVNAETFRVCFTFRTQNGSGDGIYISELDTETGTLSEPKFAVSAKNPYYFPDLPEESVLYAVCDHETALIGFKNTPSGLERLEPHVQFQSGEWLCQISKLDRELLVNCYGNRNIARVALAENGAPQEIVQRIFFEGSSVNPSRQKGSFPHSVNPAPNGRVYVCDLGADKIWILRWEETVTKSGTESESGNVVKRKLIRNIPYSVTARPGCGPRHMVFHPTLPLAYVNNELFNDVTVYRILPDGMLDEIQIIETIPRENRGKNFIAVSEMRLTPDGKFLYVANRGHNSITAFRVEEDGRLTFLETEPTTGSTPRGLVMDPTGKFLVSPNRNGVIQLLKIESDGTLTPTASRYTLPGDIPSVAIMKK
ncbi:MAG: beta-propeller fold lactonase family protein [Planctomycetia bacterium]|nr:beta-propeller fold lactonase family protein [Planctomycetia bacterium]